MSSFVDKKAVSSVAIVMKRWITFKFLFKCAICTSATMFVAFFFSTDNHKSRELLGRKRQLRELQDTGQREMKIWEGFYADKFGKEKNNQSNDHSGLATMPTLATSGGSGYVITQTFGGQMTRAIKNMMLLQCWGATLGSNLHVVEPFSARSELYHSPSFWDGLVRGKLHNAAKFSEFYDLQHFNKESQKHSSLTLVTWENFLENAPRNSVVLVVPQQTCTRGPRLKAPKVKVMSTCSYSKDFWNFVSGLERYNFRVLKVRCVDCSGLTNPLTLKELRDELYTGLNISNITLIINAWRNYARTSSWLEVPHSCTLSEASSSLTRLRPSISIANHTQYYQYNVIRSQRYVAVMLRIERFLTEQVMGRTNETLLSCKKKVLELYDKIKKESGDMGMFLTLDVGRFGSHVMQNLGAVSRLAAHGEDSTRAITYLAKKTIDHIYKGRFTLKTWEETFIEASGGITEMGYIAMLQRNIAKEANCLILMGGGYYQQVAAYQYIQKHPDPSTRCLHTVCVTPDFDTSSV